MAAENKTLGALLAEAGTSPRGLAKELNRRFGCGTVSATAPYAWRDQGRVPHAPLPALVAEALSAMLRRPIAIRELWPHLDIAAPALPLATTGFDERAMTDLGFRAVVDDLLQGGLMDRRRFLAATGPVLSAAVWSYAAAAFDTTPFHPTAESSGDPLVAQIEASIPMLQHLDDARGGAANLLYVDAQVRACGLVLQEGRHRSDERRRLLRAFADLSQLAGWMAVDAGEQGSAQRHFLRGLSACKLGGYSAMAAHILADVSYQAGIVGDAVGAVRTGRAAADVAAKSHPSVVAAVASRRAFTAAIADDLPALMADRQLALDTLEKADHAPRPTWLYYLTPGHLESQAGYAYVHLGRSRLKAGDRRGGRASLREGIQLLRNGPYDRGLDDTAQRRPLYEGAWLALGHLTYGDVDEACRVAALAIPRLEKVASPRSIALLQTFATELRRRHRNPYAADFMPALERALQNAAVTLRTTA